MTPKGRIFFKKLPKYVSPEKIYSSDKDFIDHVVKTWNSMETGLLGVALVGGKGLGKSLTGNEIAAALNVPVLRIKEPVRSLSQLEIVNSINSDCVLFLDEFEKIVKDTDNTDFLNQEELLSFLDGGGNKNNKVMFIVTANRSHHISEYLKNRPSRIRYYKEYKTISSELVVEIVDDLLARPHHKEDLLSTLDYNNLNVDVLIAVIKEINLHDKPYSSFKQFFNYKESEEKRGKAFVMYEGKEHEMTELKGYVYDGTNLGKIKRADAKNANSNQSKYVAISTDEDFSITENIQEVDGLARYYDENKKEWIVEEVTIKIVPAFKTIDSAYSF